MLKNRQLWMTYQTSAEHERSDPARMAHRNASERAMLMGLPPTPVAGSRASFDATCIEVVRQTRQRGQRVRTQEYHGAAKN